MSIRFARAAIALTIMFASIDSTIAGDATSSEATDDIVLEPFELGQVGEFQPIGLRIRVTDGRVPYRVLAEYMRSAGGSPLFCGIQFIADESANEQEPRFYGVCSFDYYASITGVPPIECREPSAIFYHPRRGLRIVSIARIVADLGPPPNEDMDAYLERVARRYGFARSWSVPGGLVRDTDEKPEAEPGATDNPGEAQRLREDH